jgi:hypothetical protein
LNGRSGSTRPSSPRPTNCELPTSAFCSIGSSSPGPMDSMTRWRRTWRRANAGRSAGRNYWSCRIGR